MYKFDNSSNQSSSSLGSSKSIGEKWKSIIGRVGEEPLLEDEDVPAEEFYESSPEINKYKGVDDTLLESEPKWRCVSDESFLNMEKMVMSPMRTPLKRITENVKEVDTTNLISFSPFNAKEKITEDLETSTADNEYDTCESGTSRLTDVRKTSQLETSYDYITCDSGESRMTDAKVSVSYEAKHHNSEESCTLTVSYHNSDPNNSQSSSQTRDDSLLSSQPSEANESLKFNDTLEEMEHLLKYGMNYVVGSDEPRVESAVKECETKPLFEKYYENDGFASSSNAGSDVSSNRGISNADLAQINLPKSNVNQYRDHNEIDAKSPAVKKTAVKKIQKEAKINNKENNFRLRSPRLVLPTIASAAKASEPKSWFQSTGKTPTKPRKFFYDTPPKSLTPKLTPTSSKSSAQCPVTPGHSTPCKYTNIMSPVQYYIKNSPTIPKIQNVSPGVNLWEKQSHRPPYKGKPVKSPKENVLPLQEKAYQQPKTTRVIEASEQRLPKNFKVGLMAESLPKPLVIKHQHREAGVEPLRERNHMVRQGTYTLSQNSRDSFANLDVVGGEISVCIGRPAARTRTLK